jgi:zinc transporter ZupT
MEYNIFEGIGFAIVFLTSSVAVACACIALIVGVATMCVGVIGLFDSEGTN